ncbi:hypothetical protein DSO57_1032879 [Entomophthora muscae]|uniref:Uncharacterized protein n=1 Tax=Entomophthora muscae TaxID=34485 RepID=A0ACC2U9Y4_9FUNG|nr:hypothetical protein DSO57_1032879 [Entomophthora muscae]
MLVYFALVGVCAGIVWWAYNVVNSIWFGPLRDIPSPLVLQLFPILFDVTAARGVAPFLLEKYHLKYGPVFRIGWTKVICVDPDAAVKVFSTYKVSKGRIYDSFRYFGDNLLTMNSRDEHLARRRLVSPAFTRTRIMEMEPIVVEKGIKPLLSRLDKACDESMIDILHQLHYMSWDIIGELGFGQSFKMVETGGHPAVTWLSSVLNYAMVCYAVPFLSRFKSPEGEKLRKFSQDLLDSYHATKASASKKTLISHFTEATEKSTGKKMSSGAIFAEAHLMLFAGTDTTSNTLGFFFHQLITHPRVYAKVVKEVRSAQRKDGILDYETIVRTMPTLQAAIKETMRLLPAVSAPILRRAPREGLQISGHFLPEDTEVTVPLYCLHRSPMFWDKPREFLPERWLGPAYSGLKREIDPRCFIPFIMGPRGCIGKDLAMLELNLVCANVLARFDLTLVTGHPQQPTADLDLVALPILCPKNASILVTMSHAQ